MAVQSVIRGLPRPTGESQTVIDAHPVAILAQRLAALAPDSLTPMRPRISTTSRRATPGSPCVRSFRS